MEKTKAILAIFLAFFLCLSLSAVYAQDDQSEPYAKINSVDLNGQGDYLTVEPGELVDVYVFYEFWCPYWSLERTDVIVIGIEDEILDCVEDWFISPGNVHNFEEIYDILAPTEPGTYHIMWTYIKGYTCQGAEDAYRYSPDTREIIGTIEVIDSGSGEWKLIYDEQVGLTSPLGLTYYKIEFYQRGNELRMEIDTLGTWAVKGGSLSISVEEDVYVNYETGKVYENLSDGNFREITTRPSSETVDALIQLLMGFVPCAGMWSSTVNLGEAIYEGTKDEFTVDYEVNRGTDILDGHDVHKIFTESRYLNERDIVVVPWAAQYALGGMYGVRVDCPQIVFPSKGKHAVVFCLIAEVHDVKVRHHIALPIEIGKQKIEIIA